MSPGIFTQRFFGSFVPEVFVGFVNLMIGSWSEVGGVVEF